MSKLFIAMMLKFGLDNETETLPNLALEVSHLLLFWGFFTEELSQMLERQ